MQRKSVIDAEQRIHSNTNGEIFSLCLSGDGAAPSMRTELEFAVRHTYISDAYKLGELAMHRAAVEDNQRMNLRVRPEEKARLLRAAALQHTDLTDFVTRAALREAEAVIEAAEVARLSGRDFVRVLELLENPPKPNAKLRAAISALPETI